jgi:polyferredoxin
MIDLIWRGAVIGTGATILMDLWAVLLAAAFGQPWPNWALPGRWVVEVCRGRVFHDDIGNAPRRANEQAIGWIFHYAVGIIYGIALVLITGPEWLAAPTFLPAFIWGIVTVAGGWFLLAPGMGAGWAASKRPDPMKVRAMNLVAHTVFAIGLYGTALLIR